MSERQSGQHKRKRSRAKGLLQDQAHEHEREGSCARLLRHTTWRLKRIASVESDRHGAEPKSRVSGNLHAHLRVLSERIDNFVRKERAVADEGRKRHRRVWVGQSNLDEILVLRPDHLAEKLAVEKKLLQNGVQVDGRFFAYSDEETREMVGQLDACHASKGVEEQVRRHL
eukprot:491204-Pleurochrysis_carterae.AAC.1